MTLNRIGTLSAVALLATSFTATASDYEPAEGSGNVEIWVTRHAEKQTELEDLGGGMFQEICSPVECAEVLNAEGELRAELLAEWFVTRGITSRVTHVFSSHKQRTRQTVEMIAQDAGLSNDVDLIADGVQQLPADQNELDAKAGASEQLTADALLALAPGSVAVVGGHSGTIYDIFELMGVETDEDPSLFPKKASDGKVPTFGDLWRLSIRTQRNGEQVVTVRKRIQLQPTKLVRTELARPGQGLVIGGEE